MTWLQTLAIAVGPAAVTALSLYFQQRLTNRREAAQREHDSTERQRERKDTAEAERRQRAADARRHLEDVHVELLNAMDEIYYKLQRLQLGVEHATEGGQSPGELPAEPTVSRLIAAHSAARLKMPLHESLLNGARLSGGDAVALLLALHSRAEATGSPIDREAGDLGDYNQLRRAYVNAVHGLIEQAGTIPH